MFHSNVLIYSGFHVSMVFFVKNWLQLIRDGRWVLQACEWHLPFRTHAGCIILQTDYRGSVSCSQTRVPLFHSARIHVRHCLIVVHRLHCFHRVLACILSSPNKRILYCIVSACKAIYAEGDILVEQFCPPDILSHSGIIKTRIKIKPEVQGGGS